MFGYARYKNWQYKNTFLLLVSFVLLFLVVDSPWMKEVLHHVGTLGYLGAFLAGVLFVSTFTVAPAGLVLVFLSQDLNPYYLSLIAGFGGVVGDYTIFRFLKDSVLHEIKPIFLRFSGSKIGRLFKTPYFVWFTPVAGAILIASPLPDEIGIGLLSSSHIKHWQFLILSFVLNSIGIFAIILVASLVA